MRIIEQGKDYTVTQWVGGDPAQTTYPNYECTRCAFATLYIEKLNEHYAEESKHKHHWAFPVGSEQAANVPQEDKSSQPVPLKY